MVVLSASATLQQAVDGQRQRGSGGQKEDAECDDVRVTPHPNQFANVASVHMAAHFAQLKRSNKMR